MQADGPVTILYVPGKHPVQSPPFAPVKPTLHSHVVKGADPDGEFELEGQLVHAPEPVESLYVPAGLHMFVHSCIFECVP
jgi:hypothetical protein